MIARDLRKKPRIWRGFLSCAEDAGLQDDEKPGTMAGRIANMIKTWQ